MKKQIISFALLLILLAATACSTASVNPSKSQNAKPSKPEQAGSAELTGLNRDTFGSYSSKFVVQFVGDNSWKYQLQTRKSAALREVNLHIEGIEKSANPGDVRMVTDGKTSWMIGPGTDEECVQFPNNQGMDPTLLYPETLMPPQDLANLMQYAGEENIAGIPSLHYSGSAPSAWKWNEAQVDVWQDKASHGLLRFNMQATGSDPFFGKGAGKLSAQYEAAALDVAEIEAVKGCEISIPLPHSTTMFVRLPGLASFESPAGTEEIRAFYQTQLPQGNWTEKDAIQQTESATVLSYQRESEGVEIQIEALAAGGSKVKIIFLQE